MRRRGLLIGGGVAVLAATLSLVGLRVSQHSAWAHNQSASHGIWHGHGARHGGGYMAGGMAHFCSSEEGMLFDKVAVYLKPKLNLNDAQEATWAEFASAWQRSEASLRQSYEANENSPEGIGDRFARAENQLDAGLTAVRTLRPAFEQFHATLDPEQKRILDRFGHR